MSETYFSENYVKSRERFLMMAGSAGGEIVTHEHPSGEAFVPGGVTVDVARFGSLDSGAVIFVISGVHGTEVTVGSGVQYGFMEEMKQGTVRTDGVTLVFVHAINPVGSARLTRVNEDNIDLNRNFVDFNNSLPKNSDYLVLHDVLCPKEWEGPHRQEVENQLQEYIQLNGMDQLLSRVLRGQYSHSDGLFYGGEEASWSAQTMRTIVQENLGAARQAAIFDIHSGVGPKGFGEIFDFSAVDTLSSVVNEMSGQLVQVLDEFPQLDTRIKHLIEFGTLEFTDVLKALRADNWLTHYGEVDSSQGREIKRNLYGALNIVETGWRQQVWEQGRDGILALINRLSSSR